MSAQYQSMVGSCDERIAKIQARLDKWKVYNTVLEIAKMACKTNEDREVFDIKLPEQTRQDNEKNNISLIKVERLIYTSLKNNANKAIYPRLLAKYDELMGLSYDMSGNLVLLNVNKETDYLDYCRNSLKQREFIKKICGAGVAGVKFFD
jgi:hypothetical protein